MSARAKWILGAVAWSACFALGFGASSHVASARAGVEQRPSPAASARAPTTTIMRVVEASAPIVIDGERDEPAWLTASGRTGPFHDERGALARPHAEARFAWRQDHLYLSLYAADLDIETATSESDGPRWLGDSFEIRIGGADGRGPEHRIVVDPRAQVTDARDGDLGWQSGARAAADLDGTVDDSRDEDEEWAIELELPLAALGVTSDPATAARSLAIELRRCDVGHAAPRTCSVWPGGGQRARVDLVH